MSWPQRNIPSQNPQIWNGHGYGDQLGGQPDSRLDFSDYDGQNDAERESLSFMRVFALWAEFS